MNGLEIRIDITPEKRREFLLTAEDLLDRETLSDDACTDCRFFEQLGVPNQFLWQEDWEDRESLEARMNSNEFRTLLGALQVLGNTHDVRITNVERRSNQETM